MGLKAHENIFENSRKEYGRSIFSSSADPATSGFSIWNRVGWCSFFEREDFTIRGA